MSGELLNDPAALDAGARDALERFILSLADGKRLLGIRYSDWLLGAPSIEAGIAASSMCQDEWGHARLLYAMLKDFGRDPVAVEHDRPAEAYANPCVLDRPAEDWAELVSFMVLVDGALSTVLEGFAAGRWELATSRVPKMLAEEAFHRDLGTAWYARLAGGSAEAQERLRTSTERMLPRLLAWLDPDDEDAHVLAGAGLAAEGARNRERFAEAVGPSLALLEIDVATVEPDRADWDATRRRGPGRPDDDAVERARGDRNRALFVE
ncbi:MAG: hypothetical protein D6701_01040 [Gemmatimonadetes bacterium]|nr:MAG: hypothetical protein D6701_01040 [Gemmatimonadota bacterium]